MHYVEMMRARRVLIGYGIALLAIVAVTGLIVLAGSAHVHGDVNMGSAPTILSSSIVAGSIFGALIVATLMIPGLNAEAATTPIIWTRPTPRDTIAWRYVAIDFATIVVAFLGTIACVYIVLAILGLLKYAVFDPKTVTATLLGLGGIVMWYGVVSVVVARLPGRGPLLAGLSWAVFLIQAALTVAPFPSVIHEIIVALNYLNPFAYLGSVNTANAHDPLVVQLPAAGRAVAAWLIGVAATIASVRLWSTREA
jgi:hypothetical protein